MRRALSGSCHRGRKVRGSDRREVRTKIFPLFLAARWRSDAPGLAAVAFCAIRCGSKNREFWSPPWPTVRTKTCPLFLAARWPSDALGLAAVGFFAIRRGSENREL